MRRPQSLCLTEFLRVSTFAHNNELGTHGFLLCVSFDYLSLYDLYTSLPGSPWKIEDEKLRHMNKMSSHKSEVDRSPRAYFCFFPDPRVLSTGVSQGKRFHVYFCMIHSRSDRSQVPMGFPNDRLASIFVLLKLSPLCPLEL